MIEMEKNLEVFELPCDDERNGKYCFPCVSGLCPFNMDFLTECYPKLEPEVKMLFEELFMLRAEIAGRNIKELQLVTP
ncbi:MAG: hypothetical protein DRO98_03515 [Archaeoglobales archaeon]|nr:MAG: hypothetical protein DRO98_03515 [Archaeoglobales archaeon]